MTRRGDEEQELLDSLNKEPTPVVHQTHTEPSMNNVIAMADIASSFQRRKASIRVLREDAPETIKFVEETVPDVKKDLEIDYHAVPLDELLNRLGTDQDLGMSASNVSATLKKVGPNKIVVGNRFKWILKWIGYLFGGFGLIVWPSAILCILAYRPIGDPPDKANLGVGIVLAVSMLLTAFFSGWQDFTSSKVMNMIGNMLPAETLVVRDGVAGMIPVTDIVPGDLIRIENGTKIAADIRVIESNSLKVDNSILTGESEPISLTDKCTNPENYMESKNVLFMGTSIVDGSGTGIVVATGNNTMMGKIAKMAAKSTPMTPIQKEIYIFMIIICIAGFITALTTLFAWLFWLRVRYPLFMNPGALVIALIGALTAFLPNGLPISVSLTFTVMAQRMFKKNVLVKFLPTVETLGSIDVIASDKTGTLTQNKMSVVRIICGMEESDMIQCHKLNDAENEAFAEMVRVCAMCNRATFDASTVNLPIAQRKTIGDASDSGILRFAEEFISCSEQRAKHPLLLEVPFNSKNKYMLNIWNFDNTSTLYMKGAAEIIINRCSQVVMPNGNIEPLTPQMREKLIEYQESFAGNGERVLGCCKQSLIQDPNFVFDAESENFQLTNLTFVGLISLMDPPREDVFDAVQVCKKASIKVIMVTGDHPATAVAIARMVGIVTKEHVTEVTGNDILHQNDDESDIEDRVLTIRGPSVDIFNSDTWDCIFRHNEIVFARTSPQHKLQIVMQCQKRGHVVAVTGDGVNDAPALKQSNCGVCMGSGSEVAREAASIVLTDSKFSSIVVAIENGRMVFDNMKKVVLYLLPAGTFAELTPFIANIFFGTPIMLSAFLMIMVALGTDIAPSLAMIYEQAESDLMDRMPRSRTGERMVNTRLLGHAYGFTGILMSVGCFTQYFAYMYMYGGFMPRDLIFAFQRWRDGYHGKTQFQLDELEYRGQCVYFVTLVVMQMFNLMATRTRRLSIFQQNPFSKTVGNLYLFPAIGISLLIAVLIVYLPILQWLFNTRPVPWLFWIMPIGWGLLYFVLDELRKVIVRAIPWKVSRRIFW